MPDSDPDVYDMDASDEEADSDTAPATKGGGSTAAPKSSSGAKAKLKKPSSAFKSASKTAASSRPVRAATGASRRVVTTSSEADDDEDPLQAPDPIIDQYGLEVEVDPGEAVDQETVDHGEYMELMQRLDEFGWLQLVLLAYSHEEYVNSTFMMGCSRRDFIAASDTTLLTMHEGVLEEITKRFGNLNRLVMMGHPGVKKWVDMLETRSGEGEGHPSIYVRALTHDKSNGKDYDAFSLAEAKHIADLALAYASDLTDYNRKEYNKIGWRVDRLWSDQWTQSASNKGERFFLKTQKNKNNDKVRTCQLKTFARVLQRRIAEAEARQDPTVPVMHYVGYATNAKKRKADHQRGGTNSNWLMQCIRYIAEAAGYRIFITSWTVALISE
ncbi:hypothetical protein N0V87_006450 [Didymella glomerata]|uniref:Uncharacterized protein n=1 Tax=Didymella glomerata TaxID=749621 RepID=A0A9W8WX12_9PLEO|nr:hypothetical protein N0V87_006450 [Didymella glomerata]